MRRVMLPVFLLVWGCSTAGSSPDPMVVQGLPPVKERGVPHSQDRAPQVRVVELTEPDPRAVIDPAATTQMPGKSRKRITLDVREADIHNVLRLLAEEGDLNIVVDQSVQGTVTMRLRNVTVEDAFIAVLQSRGLGFTHRGGIVSVVR